MIITPRFTGPYWATEDGFQSIIRRDPAIPFDEALVRLAFHLFRPQPGEVIGLVAIKKPKLPRFGFYDDERAFVQAARPLAGHYNLYFTVNAFGKDLIDAPINQSMIYLPRRGDSNAIVRLRATMLDIDVGVYRRHHAAKSDPSGSAAATEAELEVLPECTKSLIRRGAFSVKPLIVFSASGRQVLPRCSIPITDANRPEILSSLRGAYEHFRRGFNHYGAKLNSTFDLPRVAALPGTLKMEGSDPALYRMVRILQLPGDLIDLEYQRWLLRQVPRQPNRTAEQLISAPTTAALTDLCKPWRDLFDGSVSSGDRSMDLVMLASKFLSDEFSIDDTTALLAQHDAQTGRKYIDRPGGYEYIRMVVENDSPGRIPDCRYVQRLPIDRSPCSGCKDKKHLARRPMVRVIKADSPRHPYVDPFSKVKSIVREILS